MSLCCVLWLLPAFAFGQAPEVTITAQQIGLYADRGVLIADGGVSIRLPALVISATHALYDLRTNRLTAAGDVSVKDASGTHAAKAYVYDFNRKAGAFAPDVLVPQYPAIEALALSAQLQLQPGSSMTFSNAQVRSGASFVPAASYTYDIPPPTAKDFGVSPVPSAALEWPVLVSRGRNGYSFARVRYDRYNGGPGAGMEEHFAATNRGYVALGETLDASAGRYDLAAYQRINHSLAQSLTGSMLPGTHALRYALTSSNRYGFAALSFAQYNNSRVDDLFVSGNERQVGRVASVRPQVDLAHDVHPGDWPVAQDIRITPAVHVDTATMHLARLTLSGSMDLGESLYSYGRADLTSAAGFWGTLPVNAHLQLSAGANFSHQAPPLPNTYRTYTAGFTWKASRAFNLVSSLTYTHDFGQARNVGRPQFSAAFDVQVRRKNGTGIEIGTILPFGPAGDLNRQAVLNLRLLR